MKKYEIRDPVYGFIPLNEWEKKIIDHPDFQRLRRIRQLGLTDMVYPGATHTRFEHSLGVMHLATLLFDSIVSNDANKRILEENVGYNEEGMGRDKQLIRLSALLHDVGHAPFSHASEEIMPKINRKHKPYKHEDYTSVIIKNSLKEVIENHQINRTNYKIEAEEVAALIEGNADILGERIFWKVLISSQLDADRGDYLLRDSHHIGVKYGIYDYLRLINTLAVGIGPESEEAILGVDEGGWHVAESLIISRYQMFTQVYFHKTRRAYDYHLGEALKSYLGNSLPPPEEIDEFMKLNDFEIWKFILDHSSDNANCAAILRRNHIREVYSTSETPTQEEEERKKKIEKRLDDEGIWYYEDEAKGLWYKLNEGGEEDLEVMIIDKSGGVAPLHSHSSIVKNMGEMKQIRIYTKIEGNYSPPSKFNLKHSVFSANTIN
ncbi:MAG: HD domain-containing protein [Halobacteriota archaeon]|nr:HD domain-containing protein [Halobacteriota archaeon]